MQVCQYGYQHPETLEEKRAMVDQGIPSCPYNHSLSEIVNPESPLYESTAQRTIDAFNLERHLEGKQQMWDARLEYYKQWAWDNRFSLGISALMGLLLGYAVYDPEKGSVVLSAGIEAGNVIIDGFTDLVKGIGEAIPL